MKWGSNFANVTNVLFVLTSSIVAYASPSGEFLEQKTGWGGGGGALQKSQTESTSALLINRTGACVIGHYFERFVLIIITYLNKFGEIHNASLSLKVKV